MTEARTATRSEPLQLPEGQSLSHITEEEPHLTPKSGHQLGWEDIWRGYQTESDDKSGFHYDFDETLLPDIEGRPKMGEERFFEWALDYAKARFLYINEVEGQKPFDEVALNCLSTEQRMQATQWLERLVDLALITIGESGIDTLSNAQLMRRVVEETERRGIVLEEMERRSEDPPKPLTQEEYKRVFRTATRRFEKLNLVGLTISRHGSATTSIDRQYQTAEEFAEGMAKLLRIERTSRRHNRKQKRGQRSHRKRTSRIQNAPAHEVEEEEISAASRIAINQVIDLVAGFMTVTALLHNIESAYRRYKRFARELLADEYYVYARLIDEPEMVYPLYNPFEAWGLSERILVGAGETPVFDTEEGGEKLPYTAVTYAPTREELLRLYKIPDPDRIQRVQLILRMPPTEILELLERETQGEGASLSVQDRGYIRSLANLISDAVEEKKARQATAITAV